MPASIFERVADELGLPPDRSEKLVRAMIREIRKRAQKGRGVKIPNLGAFSVENGELTFTPESSLARSVNQRFEGLSEERVALPEVDESAAAGEGPTTITRGFDMGAWDPLDTGGGAPKSGGSDTGSSSGSSSRSGTGSPSTSGADTDEFQAPDTDEFQAAPDTDEFNIPLDESDDTSAPDDESAPQSDDLPGDESTTATSEATSESDDSPEPSSWDVGSAQPVDEDRGGTQQDSEDTFSPSRSRGEEAPADEEKEIDPTAPLAVDDRRSEREEDDDPYTGSGFSIGSESSSESASSDAADASFDAPEADADEEDEEPNIWASDSSWDFSTVSSADVEDGDADGDADDDFEMDFDDDDEEARAPGFDDEEPEYPSYRPPDADEQIEEERPSRSIFDFDSEEAERKREAPKTTKLDASEIQSMEGDAARKEVEDASSSRTATVVFSTVAIILVLAGGWIVLGEKGVVPPPARVLGLSEGITADADPAADAPPASSPADASGADASNPPADNASADNASADNAPADNETAGDASAGGETGAASSSDATTGGTSDGARSFNRSAGGYTIVVASRSTRSGAEAMVEQFRRNLSDTDLPVDIVTGTSGGETRYRVGVGQFGSRSEAIQMRDRMQNRLPNGAWPVTIN